MDLLAPLPKDLAMMAAIHTTTEWQQKAKEGKRRKKQQKLRAQERGEETNSKSLTSRFSLFSLF